MEGYQLNETRVIFFSSLHKKVARFVKMNTSWMKFLSNFDEANSHM